jgi:hypothetical protein
VFASQSSLCVGDEMQKKEEIRFEFCFFYFSREKLYIISSRRFFGGCPPTPPAIPPCWRHADAKIQEVFFVTMVHADDRFA